MVDNSCFKRGELFLLAGPSGVGKRTLIDKLLKCSELNIVTSISWTTRPKRFNEVDGVDYFFISKEEFQEKINQNAMMEWASFFDNYYGTSREWVEERLARGVNVLLEIETIGFKQIKQQNPNIVSIFIAPPSLEALEQRIRLRGADTEKQIKMRIAKAKDEIKESTDFTYVVVNDDLEVAFFELKDIISKELQK